MLSHRAPSSSATCKHSIPSRPRRTPPSFSRCPLICSGKFIDSLQGSHPPPPPIIIHVKFLYGFHISTPFSVILDPPPRLVSTFIEWDWGVDVDSTAGFAHGWHSQQNICYSFKRSWVQFGVEFLIEINEMGERQGKALSISPRPV